LYSNIQGRVSRTSQFGAIRLTETSYLPHSRLLDHVHELGCFGFVVKGELNEQFGARTLNCGQSAVFFRPPEIVHRDRIESLGARCLYVEVSPEWLSHVRQYSLDFRRPSVFDDVQIRRIASQLYMEWKHLDDVSPLAIEGLTFTMAASACRGLPLKATGRRPLWLACVRDLIEAKFRDSVSLQDLADAASVHPVHVARQFRKYMGMSVGEFVRMRRIDFARRELSETDRPLADIALESGFSQQSHFSAAFRRIAGTTPSEFRKLTRDK
jgi:AraC family transcriptional regulator